jgi:hypothetical protein
MTQLRDALVWEGVDGLNGDRTGFATTEASELRRKIEETCCVHEGLLPVGRLFWLSELGGRSAGGAVVLKDGVAEDEDSGPVDVRVLREMRDVSGVLGRIEFSSEMINHHTT